MWIQNVTMFGDLEAGSNVWQVHWVWKGTPILEAATAFYVQMFFARRLWVSVCRSVFLHSSVVASGNISERISCHHLRRFICVRACFRHRWGMPPLGLFYWH
jgi:hypothetical protein